MSKNKVILSIVVVSHREGKIAGRTMQSLIRAAKELDDREISYRFFVNIDNGDRETTEVFENMMKTLDGKIYQTSYGDPGLARNSIIKKTKSEYVAMIDADDIVSPNWLSEGLKKVIGADKPVLAHPEAEVRFDEEKIRSIDIRVEYENSWHETLALIEGNRWCSVVIGRREYFIKNPYSKSRCGFGYEDYFFNCSTVASGIKHVKVENTVVFCLQKKGSVSDITHENYMVLPYNNLFDLKRLQETIKVKQLTEVVNPARKIVNNIEIPEFIKAEIRLLVKSEPEIGHVVKNLSKIRVEANDKHGDLMIGMLFCRMIAGINLRFLPKRIIFWDGKNGEVGNRLMHRLEWVVLTAPIENGADSNILNKLDFDLNFGKAPESVQNIVIERLIVQSKTKRIVKNSFVKPWLTMHREFLSQNHIRIYDKNS